MQIWFTSLNSRGVDVVLGGTVLVPVDCVGGGGGGWEGGEGLSPIERAPFSFGSVPFSIDPESMEARIHNSSVPLMVIVFLILDDLMRNMEGAVNQLCPTNKGAILKVMLNTIHIAKIYLSRSKVKNLNKKHASNQFGVSSRRAGESDHPSAQRTRKKAMSQ